MADERQLFGIDLDVKAFIDNANKANDALSRLKGTERFDDIAESVKSIGIAFGIMSAAALAAKVSLDAVFEAENVKATNQQFEMMAKNAGIAADVIKDQLVTAADGLADDTDILKAAAGQMAKLGDNSKRLGEVMELTQKVTAVFGGDLVGNFENISFAIANSNTRMLKQMGIAVDSEVVLKKYAKSIGLAVSELSEADKQQAIMNSVLETGKKRFGDVDTSVTKAINTWTQFKVTMGQITESLSIMFDKVFGNAVRSALSAVSSLAKAIKYELADSSDQAKMKINNLRNFVKDLKEELKETEDKAGDPSKRSFIEKVFGWSDKSFDLKAKQLRERITQYQGEIDKAIADAEKKGIKTEPDQAAGGAEVAKDHGITEEILKNRRKYAEELLAIKGKNLADSLQFAESEQEVDLLQSQIKQNLIEQTQKKIEEIRADNDMRLFERVAKEKAIEEELQLKLREMAQETAELKIKALEKHLSKSTSVGDGIARAATLMSARAQKETLDFGKRGEAALNSFGKHGVDALLAIGDGSKTAGEAMKGFMFGAIADIAQAEGQLMFGRSIWPPQPQGIAGGMALIALAGFLRGQAKGASSGGGAPSMGSVGSPEAPGMGPMGPEEKPTGEPVKQKSVTLQIMGSYYETEQTKQRLLEMIRESTDATDFKYVQIGSR